MFQESNRSAVFPSLIVFTSRLHRFAFLMTRLEARGSKFKCTNEICVSAVFANISLTDASHISVQSPEVGVWSLPLDGEMQSHISKAMVTSRT